MGPDKKLDKEIHRLADDLQKLHQRATREYTPLVDDIIRTKCRDAAHIEKTLDGLLGFCGYEPALLLYRRLCRYYFPLNPEATAFYVNSYREYFGSEPLSPLKED